MQEYWSGLPFPSPGDLPNPGTESGSPALEADSLPTQLRGKHCILVYLTCILQSQLFVSLCFRRK